MTTAEKQTVSELARAAMERLESPDPRAVAELVAQDLDDDEMHRFALQGITHHVRSMMHNSRDPKGSGAQSARWDNVKMVRAELDLARISIWTGEQHKWLLDCSATDLEAAADQHMAQAAGHEKSAELLGKLATTLRRAKKAVVGDLGEDNVRSIFDA